MENFNLKNNKILQNISEEILQKLKVYNFFIKMTFYNKSKIDYKKVVERLNKYNIKIIDFTKEMTNREEVIENGIASGFSNNSNTILTSLNCLSLNDGFEFQVKANNTVNNSSVHLTGDEEITGIKAFETIKIGECTLYYENGTLNFIFN